MIDLISNSYEEIYSTAPLLLIVIAIAFVGLVTTWIGEYFPLKMKIINTLFFIFLFPLNYFLFQLEAPENMQNTFKNHICISENFNTSKKYRELIENDGIISNWEVFKLVGESNSCLDEKPKQKEPDSNTYPKRMI